jgi:hypothetical protein
MEGIICRKNEVSTVLRVNNGLCAVKELNVVRGEHCIRECCKDAVGRRCRMFHIEECDLVGRELRGMIQKQAAPRNLQRSDEPETVRIHKHRIAQRKVINDLNIGVASRHLLKRGIICQC